MAGEREIATAKDQDYGQFVHGDKKAFIPLYENKETKRKLRNYSSFVRFKNKLKTAI